jgi:hypothetical protein
MTGTSVGTFNKDTRMEWDDGAVGPLLLGYVEYELIDPSDAAYPAPSLAVLSSRRAAREAAELARDKRAEDALLSKVLYDILGGF